MKYKKEKLNLLEAVQLIEEIATVEDGKTELEPALNDGAIQAWSDHICINRDGWELYVEPGNRVPTYFWGHKIDWDRSYVGKYPNGGYESAYEITILRSDIQELWGNIEKGTNSEAKEVDRGASGRKPLKIWEEFWPELVVYADLDGLDDIQERVIERMDQWCIERWGDDAPSTASIKKRIVEVYRRKRQVNREKSGS